VHQIPPEPGYFRVKVRRQLERMGAVPLKNSVYLLPSGEETREDFEWLSREIERSGGEATVCVASFTEEGTEARIIAAFRESRESDYQVIAQSARELVAAAKEEIVRREPARPGLTMVEEKESPAKTGPARAAGIKKLRRRLADVTAVDFFDAPGRDEAEESISRLEAEFSPAPAPGPETGTGEGEAKPQGRTWITRQGVKVDRIASAWLIRRFIDPAASFKFVPAQGYRPLVSELRFDMFGGEFTHEGDRCTFETLCGRFVPGDRALAAIGEIVHDIDCKDGKFDRAEVGGVSSVIDGIVRGCESDEDRLQRGVALLDGLYEHFRSAKP